MAKYTHSFSYDVFISYAWIQGKPDQWVESLHAELESALQKVSGIKPRIWRDQQKLGAGSVIEPAVLDAVRKSAVYLPVVTQAWVASANCQNEFSEFSKRIQSGTGTVPVAIVEQMPAQGLPQLMQDVIRQKFHRPSKAMHPNAYDPKTRTFKRLVSDLAHEIHVILQSLPAANESTDLDPLVAKVRKATYDSISEQCGKMKVLDMTESIELASVYTDVNILEIPSHLRVMEEDEQLRSVAENRENVNRLYGIHKERIDGLKAVEKHRRLFILGKPGSGKSTFLKRLAFLCAKGKFRPNFIPVFVNLNDLAESGGSLEEFIPKLWKGATSKEEAVKLFTAGRVFLLLDGLDEVPNSKLKPVRDAVEQFCLSYPNCPVVMTCRIAAQQYNFQRFKDVEMADFDRKQIGHFVKGWFQRKNDNGKGTKVLAELDSNASVLELGSSPLLLTMLCMLAELGITLNGDRAYVYEKGVDVLLQKWDGTRDIVRDWPYKKMPVAERGRLLCEIAYGQFAKGSFFFRDDVLQKQISEYFEQRPNLLGTEETFSAEQVVKAIEAQHGFLVQRAQRYYSFSHLTFQEYFAARRVRDRQTLLPDLVNHVGDPKWREVLILTASMVDPQDLFPSLKKAVDGIVAGRPVLQKVLFWAAEKGASSNGPNSRQSVRAFYFDLANHLYFYFFGHAQFIHHDLELDRALASALELAYDIELELGRDLELAYDIELELGRDLELDREGGLDRALASARDLGVKELSRELERLQKQATFADPNWRRDTLEIWREDLRQVAIKHRNMGHEWNPTKDDRKAAQDYYHANNTLVACMNAAPSLPATLRRQIEESMLLPETELAKLAAQQASNAT